MARGDRRQLSLTRVGGAARPAFGVASLLIGGFVAGACGSGELRPKALETTSQVQDAGLADAPDSGFGIQADAGPSLDSGVGDGAGVGADAGECAISHESVSEPSLVIITRRTLADEFGALAELHTALGDAAEVVTLESICSMYTCVDADPDRDTPRAIKSYLMSRPSVRYVLLGGGLDDVPGRFVHDRYDNPFIAGGGFEADFQTDYYYSDFSEWDTNGDGVYAEPGVDTPDYRPELAVTRLPVRTGAEVRSYVRKVLHHVQAYEASSVDQAVLISNVAVTLEIGSGLRVDSAWYFENAGRTFDLLSPSFEVSKIYATALPDRSAARTSPEAERAALEAGPNIVVHSGHADYELLTTEADGSLALTAGDARSLVNSNYPIFLSSGCLAGDSTYRGAAGEAFINAPNGGAIAYLGNVPLGLGLAGGMQLIDELLRAAVAGRDVPIGDAYLSAHLHLPVTDDFTVPLLGLDVPVLDASSYAWTQKGVTLYADPLLPVYTEPLPSAPGLTIEWKANSCGGEVHVGLDRAFSGTLRVLADGRVYVVELRSQSEASVTLAVRPASVSAGLRAEGFLSSFTTP